MTEITSERGRQMAAATRLAAKLRDFHDGLPAEEQVALHVALGHGASPATGRNGDVAGYAYPGPTLSGLALGVFTNEDPINPDLDWCGTCRNPQDPARLPR